MFFDLSEVENVTIDAIMYLLAIIKNLQNYGLTKHNYSGNMPKCEFIRKKFIESGFLKFVNSRVPSVVTNDNKIAIRTGHKNDSIVLKEICDFIIKKANCTKIATKGLYVLMAEMMYNTSEHAYASSSLTMKNWYIFVENENEKFQITFLDTGLGIPKTMRKRFKEKLVRVSEDELIISALMGELRSTTKLAYRNNGLPTIRRYAENHQIENLHILSNKAVCKVCNKEGKIQYNTKEQKDSIMGTIYYWEIPINKLMEAKNVKN